MSHIIWVVTPPDYIFSRCFFDQAYPLQAALKELGHECEIVTKCPAFTERNVIVLGANLINQQLPPYWTIYNLEQVEEGCSWITPAYIDMLKKSQVWDYQEGNVSKLGIDAKIVPIGYMPCMEKIQKVLPTIDILHYGSMNERRHKVIQEIQAKGVNVQHAFKVFGKIRDDILARTKIVLNISFYEGKIFNITRCGYLFANKVAVVSEDGVGILPDASVYAPYDRLADVCIEALGRYDEIGNKGYEVFSNLRQTAYLRDALC